MIRARLPSPALLVSRALTHFRRRCHETAIMRVVRNPGARSSAGTRSRSTVVRWTPSRPAARPTYRDAEERPCPVRCLGGCRRRSMRRDRGDGTEPEGDDAAHGYGWESHRPRRHLDRSARGLLSPPSGADSASTISLLRAARSAAGRVGQAGPSMVAWSPPRRAGRRHHPRPGAGHRCRWPRVSEVLRVGREVLGDAARVGLHTLLPLVLEPAGHTSPCSSGNCRASTMRSISSTLRPSGRSLTTWWRTTPAVDQERAAERDAAPLSTS